MSREFLFHDSDPLPSQVEHQRDRGASTLERRIAAAEGAGAAVSPTLLAGLPDHDRALRRRLLAAGRRLAADPGFRACRESWDEMDRGERLTQLARLAALYGQALGIVAPPLVAIDRPPGRGGAILNGNYLRLIGPERVDCRIQINADPAANWPHFLPTLSTVLHETTHHWQHGLAQSDPAGLSPARRLLARIFAANHALDDESELDFDQYREQPIERNARRLPAAFIGAALKAESHPPRGPAPRKPAP